MISIQNNNILMRLPGNQVLVLKDKNPANPTDEEKRSIQELKKRDSDVRSHEARHMKNHDVIPIGGPQYTYTIGPDGKPYATGGKVAITTGVTSNPDVALRKARAMRDSALSSGDASPQDLGAAESAKAMEMEALAAKAGKKNENDKYIKDATIKTALDTYKDMKKLQDPILESSQKLGSQDDEISINLLV